MICVISHNREDVLKNENGEHTKQVNIVIKTLFHGISGDEMNFNLDTLSSGNKWLK